MKQQYIESVFLTVIYIIGSGITVFYFNASETLLELITYPAKVFLETMIRQDFSLKTINLMLFIVYFLWAFNCVYLNIIKLTLKQLNSKAIKKL